MTDVTKSGNIVRVLQKTQLSMQTIQQGTFPSEGTVPHHVAFSTERFDERVHAGVDPAALGPSAFLNDLTTKPIPRIAAICAGGDADESGAATIFWRGSSENEVDFYANRRFTELRKFAAKLTMQQGFDFVDFDKAVVGMAEAEKRPAGMRAMIDLASRLSNIAMARRKEDPGTVVAPEETR